MATRRYSIRKKRFLKIVILMCALFLTIGGLQRYYLCGNNQNAIRLRGFYKEDKNSLDVVLLGASEVYSSFNAGEFYKKTGVTSYPYAFEGNPVTMWKYQLDEILSRQTPKVLIVELNGSVYEDDMLYKESSVRYMADNMHSLANKWDIVSKYGNEDTLSYFFPIIKYHSRWDQTIFLSRTKAFLGMDKRGYSYLKGVFTHTSRKEIPEELSDYDPAATRELNAHAEAYLEEFLQKCDESGIEHILFVRFPHLVVDDGAVRALKRYNRSAEIIREHGYEYIDLDQCCDEAELLNRTDFYNKDHMLMSGQKAFTDYFSGYLQEKYNLKPSDLTPKQQKNWEQCVKKMDACYTFFDAYMKNPTCDDKFEIYERSDILDKIEEYM